ncbi:MAG TPA: 3-isopropylmalate dehydratase small subunit [Solirubrobacteraceae bacterium]|nr:3-isopropylmalate dehydratase small subunit [Solirubrobacteraceae bacterium]
MKPFVRLTATTAALPIDNVETDQLIPARMCVRPAGASYADALLAPWRYLPDGAENPEFVLNRAPYRTAQILVTGANFGYGSSREHAAWAVRDFGIRAIVASSFATIFKANCVRNGVLPVELEPEQLADLHRELGDGANEVTIDLKHQELTAPSGAVHRFQVAQFDRRLLLSGRDPISFVLEHEPEIAAFQRSDRDRRPWIYLAPRPAISDSGRS